MPRKAHLAFTLPELFANYPDRVCDLAMALREFVRDVVPEAIEVVRWRGIRYTRPDDPKFVKGDVCGIGLYDDHVRLDFIHGAFLPDPEGLLESDPKRLSKRFVRIEQRADIRTGPLGELLLASWAHRPGE